MKIVEMEPSMKEAFFKKHPVLNCTFAQGEYFKDSHYLSIRCMALDSSCTYKTSSGTEYESCKIKRDRS